MNAEEYKKQFEAVSSKRTRLEALEQSIYDEQDEGNRLHLLECYMPLAREYIESLTKACVTGFQIHTEQFNEALGMAQDSRQQLERCLDMLQEYKDTILREREESNENFHQMCIGLLEAPRELIECMIGIAERQLKIEDGSGRAWEWELRYPLRERLRTAYRLIFGRKALKDSMG